MSALANFYYTEKLIQYGRRKTQSYKDDVGLEYCIKSGFLDQRSQVTEAGKSLMRFINQSLLAQTENNKSI